jgi:hypothetical protein
MTNILFRGGSHLFIGTKGFSSVDTRFVLHRGEWHPLLVENVTLDERLIISEVDTPTVETIQTKCFDRLIRSDVLLLASMGLCERLQGFDLERGYEVLCEGGSKWLNSSDLLCDPHLSQTLAIEGMGGEILAAGLVPGSADHVFGCVHSLIRPIGAYMRKRPFTGVTRINEGAMVSVVAYENGCLRLDVDGEEFWYPIEESFFKLPQYKDDEFYFNLDADHDKVPDMINYAPSHTALGANVAGYETNFNQQPNLTDVAGLFSPEREFSNDDTLDNVSDYPPTQDVTGDMINKILAGGDINRMFGVDAETKPYKDELKK